MQTPHTEIDIERLIRIEEVKYLTGLSTATIYRKMAAAEFPSPVRVSTAVRRWPLSEIQNWIGKRIALREECRASAKPVSSWMTNAQIEPANTDPQGGSHEQ